MVEVLQTEIFDRWFRKLCDRLTKARIQVRIDRLALGLPGDVRPVGEGSFRTAQRNRSKTRGATVQAGWPRQRMRSGMYGTVGWPGMLRRSPR